MSQILLLRHALAMRTSAAMSDFDRPLSEAGVASLKPLSEAMLTHDLVPERIVLSGSRRTRETTFILIAHLEREIETIIDDTIYHGGTGEYLKAIKKYGDVERLMLVAHNPTISDLALNLTGQGDADYITKLVSGFPTSGLAVISFETVLTEINRKQGTLQSFPVPQ